jgi:cohesin domain-containing protein
MRALKRAICGLISLLAACLFQPQLVNATIIEFSPPSTSAALGSSVVLDIVVMDVADLYAFQFSVKFDPSILSAQGETEGPFLPMGGPTFFINGAIDNITGSINFTGDTLIGPIPGVTGTGVIASIAFAAVGGGTSPLSFADVLLLASTLSPIDTSVGAGSVIVSEPSPLSMLAGGVFSWRL